MPTFTHIQGAPQTACHPTVTAPTPGGFSAPGNHSSLPVSRPKPGARPYLLPQPLSVSQKTSLALSSHESRSNHLFRSHHLALACDGLLTAVDSRCPAFFSLLSAQWLGQLLQSGCQIVSLLCCKPAYPPLIPCTYTTLPSTALLSCLRALSPSSLPGLLLHRCLLLQGWASAECPLPGHRSFALPNYIRGRPS